MKRLALVVAVALLMLGGVAYASVPSPDGTVHGCYKNSNGDLVVVDADAGQPCPMGYTALNWNQPQRLVTTMVTSTQGSGVEYQPGDGPLTAATCPSGSKVIAGGWEYNPSQNLPWDTFRVVHDKPVLISQSYPTAWRVRFQNATTQPQVMSVAVYAICTPV